MDKAPREEEDSERRALLLVVLLVMAGAIAGLLLVWRLTRPAPKLVKLAPPIAPRKSAPPPPEEEEQDRLYLAPQPEDMPYHQFAEVMGFEPTADTSPDLKAFGEAVKKVPELKAEIEKCKRTLNKPPSERCLGRDLLKRLEQKESFQELSTSAAFQAAFTEALKEVLKTEEGKELVAVAQAAGGKPNRELANALKGRKMKRQVRAFISTLLATLAAMQREAELLKSTATIEGKPDEGGALDPAHETDVDLAGLSPALTERIKKLLEVYPWLAPLGVRNLIRIEEAAPRYGLYGACFSLLLHFECWDACKSDPTGKCLANRETWEPWDACHDWKGTGEAGDKVCISRCLYQSPCVVPPPVWTNYCVCRPGCCGKGGCKCCLSPYHSHSFCRPLWEGDAPPAGSAAVPLPPEMFYPACTSHGEGANHCDCCYDKTGKFDHDVRDPHSVFGPAVQSSDGSACGFSCQSCGPMGCLPANMGPTQTQERAKAMGRVKSKKFVADNADLMKMIEDAKAAHAKEKAAADSKRPQAGSGRGGGSGPKPAAPGLAVPRLKGPLADEGVAPTEAAPTEVQATAVKPTDTRPGAPSGTPGAAGTPVVAQGVRAPEMTKFAPRAPEPALGLPQPAAPPAQPASPAARAPEAQPAGPAPGREEPEDEAEPEPDSDPLASKPTLLGRTPERELAQTQRRGGQWVRASKPREGGFSFLTLIGSLAALGALVFVLLRLKAHGFFDIKREE